MPYGRLIALRRAIDFAGACCAFVSPRVALDGRSAVPHGAKDGRGVRGLRGARILASMRNELSGHSVATSFPDAPPAQIFRINEPDGPRIMSSLHGTRPVFP